MSNNQTIDTDAIDRLISHRIKLCRLHSGLTQTDLSKALNISVQQVQKYENGINRISSGKLQIIANICNVHISHFFDSCNDYLYTVNNHSLEKNLIFFIRSFQRISDPNLKKIITELVKIISENFPPSVNTSNQDLSEYEI